MTRKEDDVVIGAILGMDEKDAEILRKTATRQSAETTAQSRAPYPWCRGNPTVEDCVRHGYCRRDPNCGE